MPLSPHHRCPHRYRPWTREQERILTERALSLLRQGMPPGAVARYLAPTLGRTPVAVLGRMQALELSHRARRSP